MKPLNANSVASAKRPENVLLVCGQHNLRKDNAHHRHRAEIDEGRTRLNQVLVGPSLPSELNEEGLRQLLAAGMRFDRRDKIVGIEFIFQMPRDYNRESFWRFCQKYLHDEGFLNVLHAVWHLDQGEPHIHVIALAIENGKWVGAKLTQGRRRGTIGRGIAFFSCMRALGLRPDRPNWREAAVGVEVGGRRSQSPALASPAPTSNPRDFILGTASGAPAGGAMLPGEPAIDRLAGVRRLFAEGVHVGLFPSVPKREVAPAPRPLLRLGDFVIPHEVAEVLGLEVGPGPTVESNSTLEVESDSTPAAAAVESESTSAEAQVAPLGTSQFISLSTTPAGATGASA